MLRENEMHHLQNFYMHVGPDSKEQQALSRDLCGGFKTLLSASVKRHFEHVKSAAMSSKGNSTGLPISKLARKQGVNTTTQKFGHMFVYIYLIKLNTLLYPLALPLLSPPTHTLKTFFFCLFLQSN